MEFMCHPGGVLRVSWLTYMGVPQCCMCTTSVQFLTNQWQQGSITRHIGDQLVTSCHMSSSRLQSVLAHIPSPPPTTTEAMHAASEINVHLHTPQTVKANCCYVPATASRADPWQNALSRAYTPNTCYTLMSKMIPCIAIGAYKCQCSNMFQL